jgi:hypothetical protein
VQADAEEGSAEGGVGGGGVRVEVQAKGAGEDEGVLGDDEEALADGVAGDGGEVNLVY